MSCMFEGATLRTAGFETFSQAAMTDSSALLGMLLMFIGGSPTGTAGGAKTASAAILFILIVSVIQRKKAPEVFKRRIPAEAVHAALLVVMLNFAFIITGTLLIMNIEATPLRETLFEVTSAITTTGLTMGVCADLSLAGKVIFIICMYAGRIGTLTLIMALRKKKDTRQNFRLAEEEILLG